MRELLVGREVDLADLPGAFLYLYRQFDLIWNRVCQEGREERRPRPSSRTPLHLTE